MRKKLMAIALALLTTLGAHAQFEKDKAYDQARRVPGF